MMKQTNHENSRGAKSSHSDDDWIVAYENHVVQGGPAPGDYPEDLSDQDKQELAAARQAIDALHGVFTQGRTAAEAATPEQPQGQLGDFRILHEIGRGGMGVVYEAEQVSMGRRVALKVLPFAAMLDKQQLNRFKNEARAVGTLNHPNIVAVHSVGTERGVHFYAMQLVEGESLAELIAELRKAKHRVSAKSDPGAGVPIPSDQSPTELPVVSPADLPTESLSPSSLAFDTKRELQAALSTVIQFDRREYFHNVARLGIQAAQALDHAHQNGIVHRDVKPGNLLLDADCKLWVADFGLARIEADAGMTMSGDILGTLHYMSPEQALGNRTIIDHRTDVYSLGATLYELLTLRPLFEGHNRQELLHKITQEQPQQPGKLNPRIPADLETIVLKAIAKDPSDRYDTAQAMADDLCRYRDGKPVQARRIHAGQRFWHWSKRNPMVAALMSVIAILATLVAVVASIGYAQTTTALAAAQHQGQLAAEERDRAERHFHAARDAVDRMLTTAASELENVPHASAVRRKLLEDALEFYEGFLEQKSTDPTIRYETALAYKRVGIIRHELGNRTGAVKSYQQAIQLLENLIQEFPKEATYGYGLAECMSRQAFARQNQEDELGFQNSQRQLKLMQRLTAEHPQNPSFQNRLVWAHTTLGNSLIAGNRLPESLPHYRRALAECEKLFREHPELPKDLDLMAFARHWLGAALLKNNQLSEAETELLQAHVLRQQLLAADPALRRHRRHLAHIKEYLGMLRTAQEESQQAEKLYAEAIAIMEPLIDDFPTDVKYRHRIAILHDRRAAILEKMGLGEEAQRAMQKMLRQREAAFALASGDGLVVRRLAYDHFGYGVQRFMDNALDEKAASAFRRAHQLYENHLQAHPDDKHTQDYLAFFLASCPAEQFQDPARAIEIAKSLLQEAPRKGDYWATLGTAHYVAGNWNQAAEALKKANTLHGGEESHDLFVLALCQWQLGQPEEAHKSYQQAVKHRQKLRLSHQLMFLQNKAVALLGIDLNVQSENESEKENEGE